jgi:Fur family ferric uptake transcriptional regulator
MKETDYGQFLRQSGLKNTRKRAAILAILEDSAQPISAERVYCRLKEMDMEADLSTVYRNLEAMTAKDIVTKINIGRRTTAPSSSFAASRTATISSAWAARRY